MRFTMANRSVAVGERHRVDGSQETYCLKLDTGESVGTAKACSAAS